MKTKSKTNNKVTIYLTNDNLVWLEARLQKWGSQGAYMDLRDIVQGCVTLCRQKGL